MSGIAFIILSIAKNVETYYKNIHRNMIQLNSMGGGNLLSGDDKNRIEKELRKRMKTAFGKGPEQITINYFNEIVVINIEGFLTKVEKLRIEEHGGIEEIRNFRYIEMKNQMEEMLKSNLFVEITLAKVYLDVHAEDDSASFMVLISK